MWLVLIFQRGSRLRGRSTSSLLLSKSEFTEPLVALGRVCCCFFCFVCVCVRANKTHNECAVNASVASAALCCLSRALNGHRARGALNTLKWDIVSHHHVTRRRIIPRQQMSRLPRAKTKTALGAQKLIRICKWEGR